MILRALGVTAVLAVAVGLFASQAAALRFDDSSYLVPTGMVGVPYFHRFTAPAPGSSGAGCDAPYIVRVDSGDLPPGLTLARTGEVTGAPTTVGTWSFWLSLRDDPANKPWCIAGSTERLFTITVIGRLPVAEVGVRYAAQLNAIGIGTPVAWALSDPLPPGLAFTPTGLIRGTPATPGAFAFNASAIDGAAQMSLITGGITVTPRLAIETFALPAAKRGRVYSAELTSRGGFGNVRCTLRPSAVGLRLDPGTGKVSGRPLRAGSFRLAFTCTDALRAKAVKSLVLAVKR